MGLGRLADARRPAPSTNLANSVRLERRTTAMSVSTLTAAVLASAIAGGSAVTQTSSGVVTSGAPSAGAPLSACHRTGAPVATDAKLVTHAAATASERTDSKPMARSAASAAASAPREDRNPMPAVVIGNDNGQ